MNSSSLRDQCCPEITSDTPHFFKIILDDTDSCEKTRIPKKFARKYGSEISSPVSLKVPNGAPWKVELTKGADGIWLHNGWAEFSKHFSLSYGSFLVFRYEGNGRFHVIIFDRSASEISYPWSGTHGSRVPDGCGFQDHAMEDDLTVEILDEIPSSRKTRARSPLVQLLDGIPPPSKKTRVSSSSPATSQLHKTINSTSTRKSSRVKSEIAEPEFNAQRRVKRPRQMKDCERKKTLQPKERAKALLQASSFKSKNPFFMVVMQPTYVDRRYEVTLPKNFCLNYLPKHRSDVILSVCHRKERSIGLTVALNSVPKLQRGWKDFVMENHLDVGDVCIFELINQTKIKFNVVIFRSVQAAKTDPIPEKDGSKCAHPSKQMPVPTKTASAPQSIASFKSQNPFFVTTINQSLTYTRVSVPFSFIEGHIEQDVVNLTLKTGGKLWPVKVSLYEYPTRRAAFLSHGWGTFARKNSLKVGDECAFELIKREDSVLRVHIFRKSAE